MAQTSPKPAGGAPESWVQGPIEIGKGADGKTAKAAATNGVVIRVGEEGEAAVAYDLDLCRMLGAWTIGAAAPVKSVAKGEDMKAIHLSGAENVILSTGGLPGFFAFPAPAGNPGERTPPMSWHDPRSKPSGPLPKGHPQFQGFYLTGDKTILNWDFAGTEVLELPGYDVVFNGGGYFTRTLQVAPSTQAIQILVADDPQPDGPVNFPTHKKTEGVVPGFEDKERVMQSTPWVHGGRGEVMIWAAGDPDGSMWRLVDGELALEVPPHAQAVTFQIACWPAPKNDPDGRGAPLFFRQPEIDLAALTRSGTWRANPPAAPPTSTSPRAK